MSGCQHCKGNIKKEKCRGDPQDYVNDASGMRQNHVRVSQHFAGRSKEFGNQNFEATVREMSEILRIFDGNGVGFMKPRVTSISMSTSETSPQLMPPSIACTNVYALEGAAALCEKGFMSFFDHGYWQNLPSAQMRLEFSICLQSSLTLAINKRTTWIKNSFPIYISHISIHFTSIHFTIFLSAKPPGLEGRSMIAVSSAVTSAEWKESPKNIYQCPKAPVAYIGNQRKKALKSSVARRLCQRSKTLVDSDQCGIRACFHQSRASKLHI